MTETKKTQDAQALVNSFVEEFSKLGYGRFSSPIVVGDADEIVKLEKIKLPDERLEYSINITMMTRCGNARVSNDPRVRQLLEFGKEIRPRELFPVLEEEATYLIEENPFAFAMAGVLDRGTKSEIIWTIPYYIQKQVKATFERIHGVGPGISSMIILLLEKCFRVRFDDIDHRDMDVKADTHIIRVFHRLGFVSEPNEANAIKAAKRLNPEYPGALDAPTWIIGKKWCSSLSPKCHGCPLDKVCPKKIA
ncbi:MAG: hypothetical protein ABH852_04840 [Methanobacteriota archaeon]